MGPAIHEIPAMPLLAVRTIGPVPGITALDDGENRDVRRCRDAFDNRGTVAGPLGDDPGPELSSPIERGGDPTFRRPDKKQIPAIRPVERRHPVQRIRDLGLAEIVDKSIEPSGLRLGIALQRAKAPRQTVGNDHHKARFCQPLEELEVPDTRAAMHIQNDGKSDVTSVTRDLLAHLPIAHLGEDRTFRPGRRQRDHGLTPGSLNIGTIVQEFDAFTRR